MRDKCSWLKYHMRACITFSPVPLDTFSACRILVNDWACDRWRGVERRAMVSKALKRLCEQAGMPYHSPHKLRHGFTVYALKSAKTISELKAISQNLMHSSLTITDSIYGVLSGEDVASRIAGLGRMGKETDIDVLEEITRLLIKRV